MPVEAFDNPELVTLNLEDVQDLDLVEIPEEDSAVSSDDSGETNSDSIGGEINDEQAAERLFSPSLCSQRYQFIFSTLPSSVTSVLDLGCNNCRFLSLLKEVPGLALVAGLDLDLNLLHQVVEGGRLRPLPSDYLGGPTARTRPLELEVWQGSVADIVGAKVFAGVELVTCLELIEHLEPEVLDLVPATLLGTLQPQVAVVTTPNSDFNPLFPDWEEGRMRHWDHKFEWSREEFVLWTSQVVATYPDYTVELGGVGYREGCEESHGPASQIAVFRRKKGVGGRTVLGEGRSGGSWSLVGRFSYPARVDVRSRDERLQHEVEYHLRQLVWDRREEDVEGEGQSLKVVLADLLKFEGVNSITQDVREVGQVLEKVGHQVDLVMGTVTLELEEEPESEEDEDDYEWNADNECRPQGVIDAEEECWD